MTKMTMRNIIILFDPNPKNNTINEYDEDNENDDCDPAAVWW